MCRYLYCGTVLIFNGANKALLHSPLRLFCSLFSTSYAVHTYKAGAVICTHCAVGLDSSVGFELRAPDIQNGHDGRELHFQRVNGIM